MSVVQPYIMKISRKTVDKLGVKLYDRVSAVLAELISNSYDADATTVTVTAPMATMLAVKNNGVVTDQGFEITVMDDGHGMDPQQVNDFYLVVGGERRADARRGDISPEYGRRVMGRKGIGKLAPFGICSKIEILTVGGELIEEQGIKGYRVAHLILDRDKILSDDDADYFPEIGPENGQLKPTRGTKVRLFNFFHRRVPDVDELVRQLAQRFGLKAPNWCIYVVDSLKSSGDQGYKMQVGEFKLEVLDGTRITFAPSCTDPVPYSVGQDIGQAIGPNGPVTNIFPGFVHEEKFYPISGWAAYSKNPYKDTLMAGVRVYCRKKLAAMTPTFGLRAGFTGEHDVRSYLVGEVSADWLDQEEDLVLTDRRDIVWSDELGSAFQDWGQKVVKWVGTQTRQPMKKKAWDTFLANSDFTSKVQKTFPSDEHKDIRTKAMDLAKMLAQNARVDELENSDTVDSIARTALTLAPHVTLDDKLRVAADKTTTPLSALTQVLRSARLAELASFGGIAEERLRVIERLKTLKDDPDTLEDDLQDLIAAAPFLINPQWSPLTDNKTFSTLVDELEKFYYRRTGQTLVIKAFAKRNKRADFVLSHQDGMLQVVEIKKPAWRIKNEEYDRIDNYHQNFREFLTSNGNADFQRLYREYHITVVCAGLNLTGAQKTACEGLQAAGVLTVVSWEAFFNRAVQAHEDFLQEAERQKNLPAI